jgi:hypothetical protein
MIAGHFGLAAGVKARERQVPLWALMLATVWLDIVFEPWGQRTGAVLWAVVFSHWLLDLVVHRADLPILPGNAGDLPRLGFGLWKLPAVSILVELALVVTGALLYWRAAVQTATGDARRANLLGWLLLAAGIVTLALDPFVA